MCDLGSQAYGTIAGNGWERCFRFPRSWARAQIINANTGAVVNEGEAGLLRNFDLTNVRSVVGVQA